MAIDNATKEEGVKEVVAKDLKVFPLIFGLHVSGDIVNQSLKRKINLTAIASCIFTCLGSSGVYITWALSLQIIGSYLSSSEEQSIGQGIGIWWFKCPRFAQVSSTWAT